MSNLNFQESEQIVFEVKRHWFNFTLMAVSLAFGALAPLFFGGIASVLSGTSVSAPIFFLCLFFYLIWIMVLWIFLFIEWTDYYLDMWIVTSDRIIDIEQRGLFTRDIAELRYESIEDIKVVTSGIIATWLGFGDIESQTAGSQKEFVIKCAKDPLKAKDAIYSILHSKEKESKTVKFEEKKEELITNNQAYL